MWCLQDSKRYRASKFYRWLALENRSYFKISWSLEAAKYPNSFEIWEAAPHYSFVNRAPDIKL